VRKHLRISHQATNLVVFLLRGIALYLRHSPRIWQLKYPRPWELAIFKKEKKGVRLGAAGIDYCRNRELHSEVNNWGKASFYSPFDENTVTIMNTRSILKWEVCEAKSPWEKFTKTKISYHLILVYRKYRYGLYKEGNYLWGIALTLKKSGEARFGGSDDEEFVDC